MTHGHDRCCVECFEDPFLKALIRKQGALGDCDYCGSTSIRCVDPCQFTELFEEVVNQLYEVVEIGVHRMPDSDPMDYGEPLADLLDEEWRMFSERMPYEQRAILLDDVLNCCKDPKDDRFDVSDLWTGKAAEFIHVSFEEHWRYFCWHLQHSRRFIVDLEDQDLVDPQHLIEESTDLIGRKLEPGTELYRARLGGPPPDASGHQEPFPLKEMGAPPAELILRGGRVNPPGIRVLYLALNEKTAVAEVRPWRGARVSVATFRLERSFRVADLTAVPRFTTPFGIPNLAWEIERRGLLRSLASQLSAPVPPDASELEYVPSQYLSEVIRGQGFEGMVYPTELGTAPNVVLFDAEAATATSTRLIEVTGIQYKYGEPQPPRWPF